MSVDKNREQIWDDIVCGRLCFAFIFQVREKKYIAKAEMSILNERKEEKNPHDFERKTAIFNALYQLWCGYIFQEIFFFFATEIKMFGFW